jgi:GxxExxY protein
MKFQDLSLEHEKIGQLIVNASLKIHKELGPGLLEKIYEICLAHELNKCGLEVQRQVKIPIQYDGIIFEEGVRLDLLVEQKVIVEIKAVDQINPLWVAQIVSHLKMTKMHLGYLINFNVPLIKQGIRRFRN